uniref:Uncharacterized protein n=1 Tax=Leersia perrieri TaxID=77586 RepID=A0A0D9XY93_9ORYZ
MALPLPLAPPFSPLLITAPCIVRHHRTPSLPLLFSCLAVLKLLAAASDSAYSTAPTPRPSIEHLASTRQDRCRIKQVTSLPYTTLPRTLNHEHQPLPALEDHAGVEDEQYAFVKLNNNARPTAFGVPRPAAAQDLGVRDDRDWWVRATYLYDHISGMGRMRAD